MDERLDISYLKLKFTVMFDGDTVLPKEKVSALRGGMGEMLLRQNCIADRRCDACVYSGECLVNRTIYTQMARKPPFVTGKDSAGYLIECMDHRTEFKKGGTMDFSLTLFGKSIVYLGQYLQAFFALGRSGVGKYAAKYYVQAVDDMKGNHIMENYDVVPAKCRPETVADYVRRRKAELAASGCRNEVIFETPLCLKYQGIQLQQFHAEAVFQAVFRRIQMLDYYEEKYLALPDIQVYPEMTRQWAGKYIVPRYSSTHQSKMNLEGITGGFALDSIPEKYLDYLLAGELTHIGKNTSFGFGSYKVR